MDIGRFLCSRSTGHDLLHLAEQGNMYDQDWDSYFAPISHWATRDYVRMWYWMWYWMWRTTSQPSMIMMKHPNMCGQVMLAEWQGKQLVLFWYIRIIAFHKLWQITGSESGWKDATLFGSDLVRLSGIHADSCGRLSVSFSHLVQLSFWQKTFYVGKWLKSLLTYHNLPSLVCTPLSITVVWLYNAGFHKICYATLC